MNQRQMQHILTLVAQVNLNHVNAPRQSDPASHIESVRRILSTWHRGFSSSGDLEHSATNEVLLYVAFCFNMAGRKKEPTKSATDIVHVIIGPTVDQ